MYALGNRPLLSLRGTRVAVLVAQAYADRQLWVPRYRLLEAGAEVVVIGPSASTFLSLQGSRIAAQRSIQGARAVEFDAVLVPGGDAPTALRDRPRIVDFTRAMYEQGRVVAAIERGVLMLLAAGLVPRLRVTSCPSIRQALRAAGARWVDQEVVSDGHVITSRGNEDLPAFCRAIVDVLAALPA